MNNNYVTLGQVCDKGSSSVAQKDLVEREGQYPIYGAAGLIKNVDFAHQKQPYIAVVKDGAGIGRVMKLPAYSSVIGTMQYIFPKENVDIDYLFYALQHMNLGKYFSGSTIPHIYFRDYQKERLKLPVMEVQQRQADTLSRIDALSAYGQRQIALMDEIVKSRFIELFGDPIMNPRGWQTMALEDNATLLNGRAYKQDELLDSGKYPVLRVGNFFSNREWYYSNLELNEDKYCDNGDLLYAWSASFGPQIWNGGKVIYHYHIWKVLVGKAYNKQFLCNLLEYTTESLMNDTHGIAMMHLTKSGMEKNEFIVPPLELQEQFAAFVEQTDKSKLALKQSLEKLETLKKSLMQQYFG